jgi:cytochrome c553
MADLRNRLTKEPKQTRPQVLIQEMPRTVTIERLADQYGPVDFPHARIAASLHKGMAEDSLAQAFHQSPFTLCQGCHHQSPPSANPPACASCHGKPFAEQNPGRLGLKAAYHTMCMDCHDHMKITEPANTDCSACHEQKKSRIISDTKQR